MTERGTRASRSHRSLRSLDVPVCSSLRAGDPGGFGLLACRRVLVKGALLHSLVDARDQGAVLGRDRLGLAALDGAFEAAEVGLDRAGQEPVLGPLAIAA